MVDKLKHIFPLNKIIGFLGRTYIYIEKYCKEKKKVETGFSASVLHASSYTLHGQD